MKHILIASTLIVAAVVASPQSEEDIDPAKAARQAVHREIVARLASPHRPFSRAAPRMPSASFRPSHIVKGEERIPFVITDFRSGDGKALEGYVRVADKVIFIRDARTAKYVPASRDPRFAPAKEGSLVSKARP